MIGVSFSGVIRGVIGGYCGLSASSLLRKNLQKLAFWTLTGLEKFREQDTIIILEALTATLTKNWKVRQRSDRKKPHIFLEFYSARFLEF